MRRGREGAGGLPPLQRGGGDMRLSHVTDESHPTSAGALSTESMGSRAVPRRLDPVSQPHSPAGPHGSVFPFLLVIPHGDFL